MATKIEVQRGPGGSGRDLEGVRGARAAKDQSKGGAYSRFRASWGRLGAQLGAVLDGHGVKNGLQIDLKTFPNPTKF